MNSLHGLPKLPMLGWYETPMHAHVQSMSNADSLALLTAITVGIIIFLAVISLVLVRSV